jgi:hypothetical protein
MAMATSSVNKRVLALVYELSPRLIIGMRQMTSVVDYKF